MTRKIRIGTDKRNCDNLSNLWQLLFLFLSPGIFAQDTTSVTPKLPPAQISFVSEINIERFGTDSVEAIDSSLSSFYHFDKFLYNITKEKNIFIEKENAFEPDNSIVKFSNDITAPYKFSNRTIKYYKLNRRFTEVTYVSGSKSEQMLNIIYSQNLTKGWSAGLDFRRAGAEGFFRRQRFYQSSFDVFTHYQTPDKRYNVFAYYLRNRLEQQENGGIQDFNPNENTVAQPTFLSSAENKQTDKEILLRQSLQLNKAIADSVSEAGNLKLIMGHTLRYETKGNSYTEISVDSFYQNNYFDSTSTHDSTWYQRWSNEIYISSSWTDADSGFTKYFLSAGHEYLIYKYGNPETIFIPGLKENIYGRGELTWSSAKKSQITSEGLYIFSGDNKDDYELSINLSNMGLINEKIYFHSSVREKRPDISEIRKYSNHFIWFNNFSPVISRMAEVGFVNKYPSFILLGSFNTVRNFVYYDTQSMVIQHSGTIDYYSVTLQKKFTLGNWHLDNKILWQKAANENVIHIPEWSTGHSLYFEKMIFKKALLARIGTDVRYTSSYYASRYNPALQQFYLQNTEKTSGIALVDLYVNFRIKASLFFIKAENLFSGVSDKAYFYRPDYPVTPRVIRFGLQFRFYD